MYYIMEKYNSDTNGIELRNINQWFTESAYAYSMDHLRFKTLKEARKTLKAFNLIFNKRVKCSKLVIVTEIKEHRYHYKKTKSEDEALNPLGKFKLVSDDELRERIINGSLDDPKLETTLFPNGKPSK